MLASYEDSIFNNSLIFEKILQNLDTRTLLKFRTISKTWDDGCVKILSQRGDGRWIHRQNYFEYFQEILRYSRHPKLLLKKIKIDDGQTFMRGLHPDVPRFVKALMPNSKHIRILWLESFYYPDEDKINLLTECSNIVELKFAEKCLTHSKINPDLVSKIAFKFKNLSRLEFGNTNHCAFCQPGPSVGVLKEIIKASKKLILLSIHAEPLSSVLKPLTEDLESAKKLKSLKTLSIFNRNVSYVIGRPILDFSNIQISKLLSVVKNSIENLYICGPTWEELSTSDWPTMPNLTTLSYGWSRKPFSIDKLPSKDKTPKLNFLILGACGDMMQEGNNGAWKFGLNYLYNNMHCFEDDQPSRRQTGGALTVLVWFSGIGQTNNGLGEFVKLLTDINVDKLFLNFSKSYDDGSHGKFLMKCLQEIPSLTRVSFCTKRGEDVNVRSITCSVQDNDWF